MVSHVHSLHRVLVVEDDDGLRETLAEAFADDGYEVVTARNGVEALEHVRQTSAPLDLVLLDLMMPVMDGGTFLRECSRRPWFAAVPVVVLSAAYRIRGSGVEESANVRVTLAKPFDLWRLLTLAEGLTKERRP